MKSLPAIILAVVAVGLGIALVVTNKKAAERQKTDADAITTLSNKWIETTGNLEEQRDLAAMLSKDLESTNRAFERTVAELSNTLSQISGNLARTEASLKATQDEVNKRDSKITELEGQNQQLDQKAADLSTAITNLTVQIADTERKLAASEGDKVFLQKELKRLMTEKSELERQFNDLTVLRAQVAKLKEELSIARRIDWIRQGLFASGEQKGAQKLMQGLSVPKGKPKPSYDLNVEVTADGSVRVIPPETNGAPANSPAR